MRAALFIVGAAFELFGVTAVAAPDFVPGLRRFARWALARWRPFEGRLRRWLRLPPRVVIVHGEAASAIAVGGSGSAVVSTDEGATLERKVEFLLRRDQDAQRAANELAGRVSAIELNSPRQLAELRETMEQHVSDQLARALDENRLARALGAVALVVGLVLATWGNFVS